MLKYSMDLEGHSFTYIYMRVRMSYRNYNGVEIAGLMNIVAYQICNFDGHCNVHTEYMQQFPPVWYAAYTCTIRIVI